MQTQKVRCCKICTFDLPSLLHNWPAVINPLQQRQSSVWPFRELLPYKESACVRALFKFNVSSCEEQEDGYNFDWFMVQPKTMTRKGKWQKSGCANETKEEICTVVPICHFLLIHFEHFIRCCCMHSHLFHVLQPLIVFLCRYLIKNWPNSGYV